MSGRTREALRAVARAAGEGGDRLELCNDGVGLWTPWVKVGQVVEPGDAIGQLEVLGVAQPLVSGAAAAGRAVAVRGGDHHRTPVDHGAVLVTLDPSAVAGAAAAAGAAGPVAAEGGLVFRAPSSGRYYGRPGPGKPPFVSAGDVVRAGQTICLLEVMKTFHRVTYGGAGLPEAAKVIAIGVADDADVAPGDVLLRLEPA